MYSGNITGKSTQEKELEQFKVQMWLEENKSQKDAPTLIQKLVFKPRKQNVEIVTELAETDVEINSEQDYKELQQLITEELNL